MGKLAIQLAKISGYGVVVVTSTPNSFPAVIARGADIVFANSDADVVAKIRGAAPNLRLGFDTVVNSDTVNKIARCFVKGGTIATAIRMVGGEPAGVEVIPVFSGESWQ